MDAKTRELVEQINKEYLNAECELNFSNAYELIVAVILSAQCTDKRVNLTTPKLFAKYPTPQALAKADLLDVEQIIKPCGFYHNKAKHLIEMAADVVAKFNGEIPKEKADLVSLAGVGEKTANVVLATAYNVPAIAVDTHVFRVSNRLGLASADTPLKTQKQLEKKVDLNYWIMLHYALVLHGRYICKAIKPKCNECVFAKNCKFYKQKLKNQSKTFKK